MTETYKVGSEEDLNYAIGVNRASLRMIGAWPCDDDQQHQRNIHKTLTLPLMALSMFCFVFLPQMYALVLVSDDFLLSVDNIMSSSPTIISCIKLMFFWYSKEVLRPVVLSMENDWLKDKQEWEEKVMKKSAFIGRTLTITSYCLISFSYTCFVFAPLFGLNIRLVTNITDYGYRPLLVQSYYPFDYSGSLTFELVQITQIISCSIIMMSMAIPNNYFGVLVFHLSGQFEILGVKLERLVHQEDDRKTFSKKLGVCVRRHVHLVNMVSIVEKSFTLVIFNQVLCLGFLAGCVGFRIIYALKNPSDNQSIMQIVSFSSGQIFLLMLTLADCSSSEILAQRSSDLYSNIYNSKWYMFSKIPTNDLTMIMIMSRKPVVLTAGKILQLSLPTYCSIIKSIGGYVSLLITITET